MDSTIVSKNIDQITGQLIQFVAEIIGQDVVEQIEVTRESTFTKDLEMDSIEIVAFAEKVKKKYGHETQFFTWISGMKLPDLLNLTLGQVADFIEKNADNKS